MHSTTAIGGVQSRMTKYAHEESQEPSPVAYLQRIGKAGERISYLDCTFSGRPLLVRLPAVLDCRGRTP